MLKTIAKAAASLLLIGAGVILLYIFRLQVPRHIINAATVFGMAAGILLILAGLCFPLLLRGIRALLALKWGRGVFIGFGALLLAGTCTFAGTLGAICAAQKNTAHAQSTLLVLGCQIRGSTPSPMLSDRIEAARVYLSENPEAVAVLCGGQGADEDLSEGQCMYNILTEKGIDPKRLFIEAHSVNTETNIQNALAIIEKNNLSKSVAVATSEFHQKRAAMLCSKYGLQAHAVNVRTRPYLIPVYYTREVAAVLKEAIF